MALTKDEFIDKCMIIKKKQGQITELGQQQNQEIADLIVEFQVEECNKKRASIITKYNALIKSVADEIQAIESELTA